ncbi:MAG: hypothetical protein LBD52_05440 [Prevotellaceae bacterium]|nr:hypothetical protein [Prevotellaceae bacterium]
MKKIINILLLAAMASLFVACDYNERNFPDMEGKAQIKNLVSYNHEVSADNITAIVSALRARKTHEDSVMATALNGAKAFSSEAPSQAIIPPCVLTAAYRAADVGSPARVTFPFADNIPEYVTGLASAGSYAVSAADYETVWGAPDTAFFAPSKMPGKYLPGILGGRFPSVAKGAIKLVRYDYSKYEPRQVELIEYLSDKGPQPFNAIYTYNGTAWAPYENTIALNPADYDAMGVSGLTAATAPNYLPQLLAIKFPYTQEGTVKTVVYGSKTGNPGGLAAEYQYTAGVWTPMAAVVKKTEQYVFSSQGWMFDPTITLTLKRVSGGNEPNLMKFVEYVRTQTPDKWFPKGTYTNEEHYYGFNAYHAQVVYGNDRTLYGDPAIKACTSNDEKYALFDERVEEAFPVFARLNYPTMQTHVSGVEQLLKVRLEHYFSSSDRRYFEHTLKCVKSGTGESDPAEFEYVGREQIPAL